MLSRQENAEGKRKECICMEVLHPPPGVSLGQLWAQTHHLQLCHPPPANANVFSPPRLEPLAMTLDLSHLPHRSPGMDACSFGRSSEVRRGKPRRRAQRSETNESGVSCRVGQPGCPASCPHHWDPGGLGHGGIKQLDPEGRGARQRSATGTRRQPPSLVPRGPSPLSPGGVRDMACLCLCLPQVSSN